MSKRQFSSDRLVRIDYFKIGAQTLSPFCAKVQWQVADGLHTMTADCGAFVCWLHGHLSSNKSHRGKNYCGKSVTTGSENSAKSIIYSVS